MVRTTLVNSFSIKTIRYERHHESVFPRGCKLNYIMYLKEGVAEITSGDEKFHLKPGDILFIPRGSVYSTSFDGDPNIAFGSYAYMNFPGVPMHSYKMQMVNRTDKIEELIRIIGASRDADGRTIGYLFLFLAEMYEGLKISTVNEKNIILEAVMQYMRLNPDSKIPEVAKKCGISERGLYSIFKEYAGVTPVEFKHQLKLDNAYHQLRSTNLSVEEISDLCGFSSPSYFRKLFWKKYQRTPSQVRKSK
ncbi:MAG: helix-turn-helix transcriptional regulator [Clostridia bacterium]|nr:helix-turn-helix transcriptional regulator [Clostridia bacterium]